VFKGRFLRIWSPLEGQPVALAHFKWANRALFNGAYFGLGGALLVIGARTHIVALDWVGSAIFVASLCRFVLAIPARKRYRAALAEHFEVQGPLTELPRVNPELFEEWRVKWDQTESSA
jgi:hypothetical protein